MRGPIKLLLTAAAALFGVGALLALAGWLMGGQTSMTVAIGGRDVNVGLTGIHFSRWSGTGRRATAGGELEPFTALDVDVDLGDVYVVPSDHYGVELSWQGDDYELLYTNENGTLSIWNKSTVRLGIDLGFGYGAEVRVYIPEGTALDRVAVKTNLGSAELAGFHTERLDLEADLGDVTVSDAAVGDAVLRLSLGGLDLERVNARTLDLTLSLGELKGRELSVTKALTAECDMGDAELAGALEGRTEVTNHMGDVTLTVADSGERYGYDLKTSMGEVTVNGRKSGDEAVRRDGEYTIEVKNSMGDIRLEFKR